MVMLAVQEYLRNGKTLDDLAKEFAIQITEHPVLPLVILNYDQIESPKTHPIVRDCRALTLEKDTWKVIGRSFRRFFNWGELQDEMTQFDFSDFKVDSKEDGSLIVGFFYDDKWHFNTRASFGYSTLQFTNFTWHDVICQAVNKKSLDEVGDGLNPEWSYVFELVSPYNKVVRQYKEPAMYLLAAFHNESGREMTISELNEVAEKMGCNTPQQFCFSSIEEIISYLNKIGESDPTFEGVVIRDCNGMRYKVKNPTYLSLHRMRGEGDNLYNPKHQIAIILAGEFDEILTYFPEMEDTLMLHSNMVEIAYREVEHSWILHWKLEDQKEFALAVKDGKMSAILFRLKKQVDKWRNEKKDFTLRDTLKEFRSMWRQSDALILKQVFGK